MADCPTNMSNASDGEINPQQAKSAVGRMQNAATGQVDAQGIPLDDALRNIAGELASEQQLNGALQKRNLLLNIRARRQAKSFIRRFKTLGEGLMAFMEGSSKLVQGARRSIDYLTRSTHGKYLGRLIAELEEGGLLRDFKHGELTREIYIEMGELGKKDGVPGSSGSERAMRIAAIIEGVTSEMVARQNRAGAYINKIPGYIVRQTHDMDEIRRAGGLGPDRRKRSYEAWRDFTLPLLDAQATFRGINVDLFMRNIHEALYTGTHGPRIDEADTFVNGLAADPSRKASASRVLHFKDADSAWQYNERFGIKNIRDQVFSDIYYRARNIVMMENLGPSAGRNFAQLMRELREEARVMEDADAQSDSLRGPKFQAAFDILSGEADIPQNHTLARSVSIARSVAILAKMGATTISALTDKAFMNQELAYQGISRLDRWAAQLQGLMRKSPESHKALRYMGVAMEGIIGNTISRYTSHTKLSGKMHHLQQKLFDLNFLNQWTDGHKGAVALLMSHHLADNASKSFADLPDELGRMLSLYDITPLQWDAIRTTSWVPEHSSDPLITADQLGSIPDDVIDGLAAERNLQPSAANRLRMRQELESSLRAYFADRVDFAIPTPGAKEKRLTTLGTRPGTAVGEAVRTIMMFKAFPLTILTKILQRDIFGQGAGSAKEWLMHDHRGKFNVATLIATTTILGYMSGAIRDALKGRTPKPLIDEEGKIQMKTLYDAASRGGGMGILGDFIFNEYDRQYRSVVSVMAGPIAGQLDPIGEVKTLMMRGEYDKALDRSGKLLMDNTPFINLFYIRPILDYLIFWNMREALEPGSLREMEEAVRRRTGQGYWLPPSEMVR